MKVFFLNVTLLKQREYMNDLPCLGEELWFVYFCIKCSGSFISLLLHNIILSLMMFKLWASHINEQYCYCTCLRKTFKVNYLQGKHNKRSPAPLMPSVVLKSGIKSCFGGVIFQYAVIMLYLSNDAFQSYYDLFQVNWLVQIQRHLYKSS